MSNQEMAYYGHIEHLMIELNLDKGATYFEGVWVTRCLRCSTRDRKGTLLISLSGQFWCLASSQRGDQSALYAYITTEQPEIRQSNCA